MPSLDQLEQKWQSLASEISAAVQESLEGDMFHIVIDTVRECLDRLQVGILELQRTSHILFLTGYSSFGGCETSLSGWLCFPSELEMLLFLMFVWLDLIRRELLSPNDSSRETFALLEEAIEISIRARRIPNSTLNEMIRVGFAGLADGAWLGNHFDINDSFSVSAELIGDQGWISENEPRLARLIHSVDANNPLHLELVETWLARWGERD